MSTTLPAPRLDWANDWLSEPKGHYINDSWSTTSDNLFECYNPARGEHLISLPDASAEDVDRAVTAAEAAFSPAWIEMNRRERMRLLRDIGDLIRTHRAELATLEALSNGKLYREAYVDDLEDAADIFDYYAGWTDKFYGESCPVSSGFVNYTLRKPLGVCGLIVPWNFPLLLATWKLAPALAMGNTVILKPSLQTSLTAIRLFELLDEHLSLPPGVVNLVLGDQVAGKAMSHHPRIAKVSFTGSTEVGKQILQSAGQSNLKRVTLELGGKSPDIIFDDVADLSATLERTFTVMFSQKGEKCSEPTRLFIHRDCYDAALEILQEKAEGIVCGDAFDESAMQGSQCTKEQFEKIMRYIELGKQEGARLLAGGSRDVTNGNERGFFVRPTIFADVDNKSSVAQDEIFGPVLSVIPFETEEEVIAMANDTAYGLAAGLWSSDSSRAHRVAHQLDAGMVFINRYGCYDFSSPFGGVKESGWGREMGIHSLHEYTKVQSIWVSI